MRSVEVGEMTSEDEIVMYIVINADLKMGKGKIAAQAAHSAVKVGNLLTGFSLVNHSLSIESEEMDKYILWWNSWLKSSYVKVVLKGNAKLIKTLIEKYPKISRSTTDEGRTQISGGLTSIAFFPMPRGEALKELKELKLI